ncbi:Uncharacterised protein [Escherichia coli]|uniref:Uncharacterized protein n=1 Tax=Escherichia coli TaxID=562 RepID=A0A377B119_ECOLX|nr:Uncharacterised protein [Escherichia coli]
MDKNTTAYWNLSLDTDAPNVVTISICSVMLISGSFLEQNRHVKK